MKRTIMMALLALGALGVACSDDDGTTATRTYCYNGSGYRCPDEASYQKCSGSGDCSGCSSDSTVCKL